MSGTAEGPILLELGQESWEQFTDQIAGWLRNVQLAQSSFRQLAEDTAAKIQDPRVKEMVERIAARARDHEARVDDLYGLIGREPAKIAGQLGQLTAKARQALGDVLGLMGGAPGAWHDLRQLMLANLNAIGTYGTTEQLGLTLGLPELARRSFEIVRDKSIDQVVLEEYMLELAPQAVLYEQHV